MARAEDLHSAKENKFTFQWTIANFGMFAVADEQEHKLVSRTFTVPSLDNSEWFLKLVHHGNPKEVVCSLHRTDSGPENIRISYGIFVGPCYSGNVQSFRKNAYHDILLVKFSRLLTDNGDQVLAKDVLIECHLWQSDNEVFRPRNAPTSPYPVFCSTRTIFPCEQRNFILPVCNFRNTQLIENIRVESAVGSNLNFTCELFKKSYTTEGMTFQLKFLKSNPQDLMPPVIKYRIQLMDAVKKRHILSNPGFASYKEGDEVTFLVPTSMLEKRTLYIPGDVMHLFCEFAIPDNNVVSFVESTRYDCSDIQASNPVCGWSVYWDEKYNEHRFLFQLLVIFVFILSLIIPYLFTGSSL